MADSLADDQIAAAAEAADPADGRTARRDRNRDAVLDAVLELFGEDATYPGPAEVAERSGVSRRSVYRYFEDMDSLVRAAMARNLEHLQPLFALDVGDGPLADRVDRIVLQRLRLYDAVAPMLRAALLRARSNPLIHERLVENRRLLLAQVETMFAPELSGLAPATRREAAAAADVLLEFESMEHLRFVHGLDGPSAGRVLARAVTAILAV